MKKIKKLPSDSRSILFGRIGEVKSGMASLHGQNPYCINFRGCGMVDFHVSAEIADTYDIKVAYFAKDEPASIKLTCDGKSISQRLYPIVSYASEIVMMRDPYYMQDPIDSESVLLNGTLDLPVGESSIEVEVQTSGDFRIFFIEMIPHNAKPQIDMEQARIDAVRPSIEPLTQEGYGIFMHWTSRTKPRYGEMKPYEQAVNDFDTEKFADLMDEMGAKYVVFTTNHGSLDFPAPLKIWNKYHPGEITERDLVGDLIESLSKRGIKFFMYVHVEQMGMPSPALNNKRDFSNEELQDTKKLDELCDKICDMFKEIGHRYGEGVAGYWLDGYKFIPLKYGIDPTERLYNATKEGNPNRFTTFSFGVRCPNLTPWQDYAGGEMRAIGALPVDGKYQNGQQKGLPYHSIIILDDDWWHNYYDTSIADPQYGSDELSKYINGCIKNKGLVSVNVAVYQDGTVSPLSLEVMKETKKLVYGGNK